MAHFFFCTRLFRADPHDWFRCTAGGTSSDQVPVERVRGEPDPRQLLLGLHLHGAAGRPARGDHRHQTGIRLQHADIELHHPADAAGRHSRLRGGRGVESRTGIHAGTLFILSKVVTPRCCEQYRRMSARPLRESDLTRVTRESLLASESIEHFSASLSLFTLREKYLAMIAR